MQIAHILVVIYAWYFIMYFALAFLLVKHCHPAL